MNTYVILVHSKYIYKLQSLFSIVIMLWLNTYVYHGGQPKNPLHMNGKFGYNKDCLN